jgi:hypothetical protein
MKTPLWKFQERIKQNFLFIWNDSYDMCRLFFLRKLKAFESSDKLVLEVNLSDPAELAVMQQMAMGRNLR